MKTTVYLKRHNEVQFHSEDFATPGFLAAAAGPRAIHLYAELRARGEARLGSFVAAFGAEIGGAPEDVQTVAALFENTRTFESAYDQAVERVGHKALRREWDTRLSEVSIIERDHAMSINQSKSLDKFAARSHDFSAADKNSLFKKREAESEAARQYDARAEANAQD